MRRIDSGVEHGDLHSPSSKELVHLGELEPGERILFRQVLLPESLVETHGEFHGIAQHGEPVVLERLDSLVFGQGDGIDAVDLERKLRALAQLVPYVKLVEREKVAFIFQSLGTPTNSAVHQYMSSARRSRAKRAVA